VDEEDGKVWRTFEGAWLAGVGLGKAISAPYADFKGRHGWWLVLQTRNGKFVVHFEDVKSKRASIEVYDSFESMEPHLPPKVTDEAAEELGIRTEPEYPEKPLDV
jgi:hypothetical protein